MNPSAIRHLQGGIQWGQQNDHLLSLISNHLITSFDCLPPGTEEMWFLFSESHSHEDPSDKTYCLWTPCRMTAAAWTVGVIHIWQFFTYLFTFFFLSGKRSQNPQMSLSICTRLFTTQKARLHFKSLGWLFFLITSDFRSSDHSHWPWLKVSVKALLPGVLWDFPTKGIFPQSGKISFIFILRCGISPWNLLLVCQHWERGTDLIYITNGLLFMWGR